MGNSYIDSQLIFYGHAEHPIHGEVTAFLVKNEAAKFVMKVNMKINKQQLKLYEKVEEGKNTKLLIFYGIEEKDKTQLQNSRIKIEKNKSSPNLLQNYAKNQQIDVPLYWQYFNWDLQKQIKHLSKKQQLIKEEVLWQILQNALSACEYLQTLNLYPQLRPKLIQFTVGREPKLYWCDLLPKNLHRAYERYLVFGEFRHTVYSPEELLEINRKLFCDYVRERPNLDNEKCVVFNIGIVLLEASSGISVRCLYSYRQRVFSQVKKRQLLAKVHGNFSQQFQKVLAKLLEYFPKDRYGYREVKEKVQQHKNPVVVEESMGVGVGAAGEEIAKEAIVHEPIGKKNNQCWPHF